ncbi:VanZ family protein [Flavobacterium sp. DGU11]|uniref:VanZ family protein n=1 Tax=Flavobacterium arundinis TaxID=3139143 RepID=A0ABU9HZW2_9FLAO
MRNKYFWAAIFWTLFITVACLVSNDNFGELQKIQMPNKDKVLHATFYFVFTILWSYGLRTLKISDVRKRRMWAFIIAVSYGIIMEICQGLFTEERTPDVVDAIANTTGSAIAVFVLWRYQKRHFKKKSPAY